MIIRIVLFLCFTALHSLLFAQNRLGLFAGPQATTAHYKVNEIKQSTELKYGGQAGLLLKIPFENKLYFSPALYYSLKGYKVTLNIPSNPPGETARNNDTRFHTVDLAPLLQYDLTADPAHVFFRLGPALEFAIAGTEKFDEVNGNRIDRKMKFSFADYGFVTASAIGQLGYETARGFFIFGHYAYGLGSANNVDEGPNIRHRMVGISIGKYF